MSGPLRVIDSSVLLAALLDADDLGSWSREMIAGATAHAPALNSIRRRDVRGDLGANQGELARRQLSSWRIHLWQPQGFMDRMWRLRTTTTSFDAAFVALAEHLDAPLVTLDLRLAGAPGIGCQVLTR